jgi:hypothetical protein
MVDLLLAWNEAPNRSEILAVLQSIAKEQSATHAQRSNAFVTRPPKVLVYAAKRQGGSLTVFFIFDFPVCQVVQGEDDCAYHQVYVGEAVFVGSAVVSHSVHEEPDTYLTDESEGSPEAVRAVVQVHDAAVAKLVAAARPRETPLRHCFVAPIAPDSVLALGRALFAAALDPAAFAAPPSVQSEGGATRSEVTTWSDGPRRIVLTEKVYDDDGRGGGGTSAALTIVGFSDGTRLSFDGLYPLEQVEVVHDGGLGVRLVEAAVAWSVAQHEWKHVMPPMLPTGWIDVARTFPLTEERQTGVISGHAVLADVGVRRFAASIWPGTLVHLGLVPRATPSGHYLQGGATEPREHLSGTVLFELLTGRPPRVLGYSRFVQKVEQGTHGGVLGDQSGGEVTCEVWWSDGWVLRSSRCVAPATPGRALVEVALQHGTGEPLAAFLTVWESPSGSGERSSAVLFLHGVPAIVAPFADRVRSWLAARGWSIDADWAR